MFKKQVLYKNFYKIEIEILQILEDILDQWYHKVINPYENDDTKFYALYTDINQVYVHDHKDHFDKDQQKLLVEKDFQNRYEFQN